MPSGRKPTASEVLDVLDRLQADPGQRYKLSSANEILGACVSEGLLGSDALDWLAQAMQELHSDGLIGFGPVSGGLPEPVVWDGHWLQRIAEWRVTAAGRSDASLFRAEYRSARLDPGIDAAGPIEHDIFISHAGEDKETVARPLAKALADRGWRVWLDELELTVGDSLSGRIDAALSKSRFGVVVLSPAFFEKPWPQRELQGLAAREVIAGSKVILPVWHEMDQAFLVKHSPVLADRLGALTSRGIGHVADQICRAVEAAGLRAQHGGGGPEPVLQAVEHEQGDQTTSRPN